MTFRSLGFFASSGARAKPGMVLLTPTSIAHSGTSASIGANGQVTFTAVTSLSLNGVFSATYDNYVIAYQAVSSTNTNFDIRFRVSGSDNSTANSYVVERLDATSTTVEAARTTSNIANLSSIGSSGRSGGTVALYGPFLTQPTAFRTVTPYNENGNAYLIDAAGTHNQSTSYDGFTLTTTSPRTITGTLTVYGIRS